ncbi:MAG TPA: hypothetical protein VFN45_02775 [Myxococcaceae bacterium]|jgi:hypothetical protein|nr:hypothetical protein [Myxococcaceae bacterium]
MKLLGRDIDAGALLRAARERLEARGIRDEALPVETEPEPVLEPLSFLVRALEEDEDPTLPVPAAERGAPASLVRRMFRLACQSLIDEALERQRRFNARVREADAQLSAELIQLRVRLEALEAAQRKGKRAALPAPRKPRRKRRG